MDNHPDFKAMAAAALCKHCRQGTPKHDPITRAGGHHIVIHINGVRCKAKKSEMYNVANALKHAFDLGRGSDD